MKKFLLFLIDGTRLEIEASEMKWGTTTVIFYSASGGGSRVVAYFPHSAVLAAVEADSVKSVTPPTTEK